MKRLLIIFMLMICAVCFEFQLENIIQAKIIDETIITPLGGDPDPGGGNPIPGESFDYPIILGEGNSERVYIAGYTYIYFKFTANEFSDFVFSSSYVYENVSVRAWLYDSNENYITYDSGTYSNFNIKEFLDDNEYVYLKVRGNNSQETGLIDVVVEDATLDLMSNYINALSVTEQPFFTGNYYQSAGEVGWLKYTPQESVLKQIPMMKFKHMISSTIYHMKLLVK